MIDDDVEQQLKNLDTRLARVEQFLPSVATKEDLRQFEAIAATKEDLERFATKEDLATTRRELEAVVATLATKEDLATTRRELEEVIATLATKEELASTRRELKDEIRTSAEETRRHFDVIAESLRDEIRLGLEGNIGVTSRVETLERQHGRLERRVTALEASRGRPKK